MSETKEKLCGEMANLRYTWPGRDEAVICMEHALALQNVAAAIGLHLQMIPLTDRDVDNPLEWPTCTQKIENVEAR